MLPDSATTEKRVLGVFFELVEPDRPAPLVNSDNVVASRFRNEVPPMIALDVAEMSTSAERDEAETTYR